jgi:hypothetical protein
MGSFALRSHVSTLLPSFGLLGRCEKTADHGQNGFEPLVDRVHLDAEVLQSGFLRFETLTFFWNMSMAGPLTPYEPL